MDDQAKIKTKMYLNLGFMGIATGFMWVPILYGLSNITDALILYAVGWALVMSSLAFYFGATAVVCIYAIPRCIVTGEQLHLKG